MNTQTPATEPGDAAVGKAYREMLRANPGLLYPSKQDAIALRAREIDAAPAAAVGGDQDSFERWAAKRHGCSTQKWEDSGEYTSHYTRQWWECWKAAVATPDAPVGGFVVDGAEHAAFVKGYMAAAMVHANSSFRADQLEKFAHRDAEKKGFAPAAQPSAKDGVSGEEITETQVLRACNAYDCAAQVDGETGMDSAQYPWMHAALKAARINDWNNATVHGWRTVDGVAVFSITPPGGLLPPQEFVKYETYKATTLAGLANGAELEISEGHSVAWGIPAGTYRRIEPDATDGFHECSGNPNDCPENEGFGCCKAKDGVRVPDDDCCVCGWGDGPHGKKDCANDLPPPFAMYVGTHEDEHSKVTPMVEVFGDAGGRKQNLYTGAQMRAALEAALQSVLPGQQGGSLDAARWRAVLGCARLRVLGSAGIVQERGNYAHLGLEMWTQHEAGNEGPAVEWLTKFADKCIAVENGNG